MFCGQLVICNPHSGQKAHSSRWALCLFKELLRPLWKQGCFQATVQEYMYCVFPPLHNLLITLFLISLVLWVENSAQNDHLVLGRHIDGPVGLGDIRGSLASLLIWVKSLLRDQVHVVSYNSTESFLVVSRSETSCIPILSGILSFALLYAKYQRLQSGGLQVGSSKMHCVWATQCFLNLGANGFKLGRFHIDNWVVKLLVHRQPQAWILIV